MKAVAFIRRNWQVWAVLLLAALTVLAFPAPAFADDEKIVGSTYNLITDAGKWVTNLIVEGVCMSLANTCVEWASEFWNIIAKGQLIGGDLDAFPDAKAVVGKILTNVMVPIGQWMLALCLAIDLLRVEKDMGNNATKFAGLGALEAMIVFAIKYSILFIVINHVKVIMYGIFDIFASISDAIQRNVTANIAANAISPDMLAQSFNDLTFDDGMGVAVLLVVVAFVILLVCAWTAIYTQVLCIVRIFEIFIGVAFAPAPLATFATHHLSQIGLGFVKWFCGACLQLAVLIAIITIGGPLIASITSSVSTLFTGGEGAIAAAMKAMVPIATSLSLYIMVKQSRQLADKIVGAA